jgi:succinyl-diaminopimelate desuccinylase
MPVNEELIDRLRAAMPADAALATATELVRAPTPNPPGGERRAADLVRARLERLGCREIQEFEPEPGRVSLAARWGTSGGRVLGWNGHMDVVPTGDPAQWTAGPFDGHVADGRLWGRGAADMKGSVACALTALETIAAAGVELEGEVLLLIAADEETGGHLGTAHLVREGAARGADAFICGEATELDLFVVAKGLLWMEIAVHGRACHASQPQLGRNAVAIAGQLLGALGRWSSPHPPHPLLGAPTLTPTMIHGGVKENLVPDECHVRVDRRLLPGESREAAVAEVQEIADAVAREHEVEVSVRVLSHWEPSEIDESEAIVSAARAAVEAVLGRAPAIGGTTGSTDARHLINDGGIPTLILGPGRMAEAHTVDEWIAVDQLELGTLAFAATFCEFLGYRAGVASSS